MLGGSFVVCSIHRDAVARTLAEHIYLLYVSFCPTFLGVFDDALSLHFYFSYPCLVTQESIRYY